MSENPNKIEENETTEVKVENPSINRTDSLDPSYTNLVLPYRVICRQRYTKNAAKQRAQFIKEIRQHELTQSFALHGVRLHRIFTDPISRRIADKEVVKLTPSEQLRLDQLLSE